MSRLRLREALGDRVEMVRERLTAAYESLRETRLYVQGVCALILVGAAWLVHTLPYGSLAQPQAAVEWVVTGDYDFRGKAGELGEWARRQGGWKPAMAGLWQLTMDRAREWVGPVGPFALPSAATAGSSDEAPDSSLALGSEQSPDEPGLARRSVPQTPLQPVEGSVLFHYGWLPQEVSEEFHEGIDFWAERGTPVVAVLDGTVVGTREDKRLGMVVEVQHRDVIAVYAGLEAVQVSAGDEVRRGQSIGRVAPPRGVERNLPTHLHFEIRPVATGEPVDPASYLGLGGKKL